MISLDVFKELKPNSKLLYFLNPKPTPKPSVTEYKVFRYELLQFLNYHFDKDADIYYLISLNTRIVDELLKKLWVSFDLPNNQASLIAIGGYGRRELFPESDIDIMIMMAEKTNPGLESKICLLYTSPSPRDS